MAGSRGTGPGPTSYRVAIAIPARNEAARISRCLEALADQRTLDGARLDFAGVVVLVLANCCSDDTAAIARATAPRLPFTLVVVEAELPTGEAHAGGARRRALEIADGLVADDASALLTTDADARAEPDWLARNLAALAAGADAVAGCWLPEAAEFAALPDALRRREAREQRYAARLDALAALLDPDPHDPWPRHGAEAGASIAVTRGALRRAGGVPAIPTGEDRALFAALAAGGARIRHCPAVRVRVSCRLDGRAGGGMAATLRQRSHDRAAPVDTRLEPALEAWRRGRARSLLRRLRSAPETAGIAALGAQAGLDRASVLGLLRQPNLADAIAALDRAPRLARRIVSPPALPSQTLLAVGLCLAARLIQSGGADPAGTAVPEWRTAPG